MEDFEVDKLILLNCKELNFSKEENGFISLKYRGEEYKRVKLTRLIPFYSKTTYISVAYENEEKEFKEIGVIKNIDELSPQQRKLVDDYLEYKYYMPEITRIYSIKDNMRGYIIVTADTTSGKKTLRIRDWNSNFIMLSDKMLYVVDVEGNKYFSPDIYKLDRKSLANIELFV